MLTETLSTGAAAQWVEALGFAAAGLVIATYCMKTMIPLRIMSICASVLFIVYGILTSSYPQILLHGALLPLNLFRLLQMRRLIDEVKTSANGDQSMDWIKSYSSTRNCRKGEVLFRKGDPADSMFYTVSGRYLLAEIGMEIGPGQPVGEIGMVSPGNQRTMTFKCIEAGRLLEISYDRVKELYFQNPAFGFYFLNLISQRLISNIARLEERLARNHRPKEIARKVPAE